MVEDCIDRNARTFYNTAVQPPLLALMLATNLTEVNQADKGMGLVGFGNQGILKD